MQVPVLCLLRIASAVCLLGAIGMPAARAAAPALDAAVPAERAWELFLEQADLNSTLGANDALAAVGYSANGVDPAKCSAAAEVLSDAVATVPVGIALRHAAMLCAQARQDEAGADRQLAALSSLAKLALSQASESNVARPIRVVLPADIYALLRLGGLEFRYEYYSQLHATRYFPVVVATWDPAKQQERHLRFDVVDVANHITRDDTYSGFPYNRIALADALLKGRVEGNDLIGIDLEAVRAASVTATGKDKVAKLRPAAARGDVLATRVWIAVCAAHPHAGCSDGLVDAILPRAEAHHGIAMAQLAYLYHEGIGIEQDQESAEALLAAADKLWPHDGATVEYATMWSEMHDAPLPDALGQRLLKADANGNPNARVLLIQQKLAVSDNPVLDAADLEYLASPIRNQQGDGYWRLSFYYGQLEREEDATDWTRRAAAAGEAISQYDIAYDLLDNGKDAAERAKGEALMVQSAHGGYAWAQRYMAYLARKDSRWSDAEKWLLASATTHDLKSILALAQLYERELPGVNGKVDSALRIYTSLASSPGDNGSEARRRLAVMAVEGRGMAKDPAKAEAWLLQDAKLGDHESETLLGMGYLRGTLGAIDEGKGVDWMEKAVAAKDEAALVEYGSWLYYTKKTPEARARGVALWKTADALGETLGTNNLAWALCTSPDPALYDPAAGLDVSTRIGKIDALDPPELDTVAACHAANGDFDRAVTLQEQAIKLVTKAEELPEVAPSGEDYDQGYWDRLALYRKGQRYTEELQQPAGENPG